jgi:glycosyltransferase involved in cell wall biosynthesis
VKICFIAPGLIEIPPKGWGALETVVWNQSQELKKLGLETFVINSPNSYEVLTKVNEINPDIVHLHYGKHWEIMPNIKCRKIVTNHDGSFRFSTDFHENLVRNYLYDCEYFCLSNFEKNFFFNLGISAHKIKIMPNGTDYDEFRFDEKPLHKDKSICVGKIDSRKRQSLLQALDFNIDFIGECNDPSFNKSCSHFLGPWDRQTLYTNLTKYSNLVLLSSSENCCPLVCLEALAAGLGIVISEACTENIDLNHEFICVIPEDKIKDKEYVKEKIEKNRKISSIMRSDIRKFGESRSWKHMAKKYLENATTAT